MSYFLTAYDYADALERRMEVRQAHIDLIDKLRDAGKALMGAAITDEAGSMIGSVIVFNMSKEELDKYLEEEPYITNKVWEKIEVKPCKIGPSFIRQ